MVPNYSSACSYLPKFYGISNTAKCIGEWKQEANILHNNSIIIIYDNNGNITYKFSSFKVYLDDINRPEELKNIDCKCFNKNNKNIKFLLNEQKILGTFSGDIINTGDIYEIK